MNVAYISARVSIEMRDQFLALGGVRWLRRALNAAQKKTADPMHQAKLDADIADAYRRGVLVGTICSEYHVEVPRILRAVDAAGVPRRGKGYRNTEGGEA